MNKKLEPLNAYYKLDHTCCLNSSTMKYDLIKDDENDRDCKDIEELVDCLETIKVSLEENQQLKNKFLAIESVSEDLTLENGSLKTILRIIKEKRVDIAWLMSCECLSKYNNVIGTSTHELLTQVEFDLLKEYIR